MGIAPKAAYLEGAQPKSEPTVPPPIPSNPQDQDENSSDSSRMSVDPSQSLQAITAAAFAHVRSTEFQEALSLMRSEDEEEERAGIAKAIEDAAAAVAATTEFRLVVDRLHAIQEHRVQQGQ